MSTIPLHQIPSDSPQFDDKERALVSVGNEEARTSGSNRPDFDDKGPTLLNHENAVRTIADGGTRAWMSVAGGWLIALCTFGYAQSFGVYEDLYTLSGASTPSNVAWIGSFQLFMMFAMGLPAGKLFDAGYFRHLEIGGALIFVFSLFMLSLADPSKYYQIFLSQGLGVGLGCGMMFLPALSVQAHHWNKYRAMAMGIVLTGTSVGGIIFPIMHNQLFHGSAGFGWGVRASGFLILGLLITANILLSTTLPPKQNVPKPKLSEVFGNVPYVIAASGCLMVLLGLYFPYFFLQLYVDAHGLSPNLATYTLAILNAASVFGRTIPNIIADKYGKFNVTIPIGFATGILVFAMLGIRNTGGVVVFSILYGFTSGAFISLMPPLTAVFIDNVNEIGIYMGMALFLGSFANLVGTPISGRLLGTTTFVWYKPVVFSGVVMLTGSTFVLISRSMMTKKKGTIWI